MWETVAQLKCLLLMGMALPSAIQPSFVWASERLCIFFFSVFAVMYILSVIFIFPQLNFMVSSSPTFSLLLHQRNCLYGLLLTSAAPLRLDLDPINAILCDSDIGGATAEDP